MTESLESRRADAERRLEEAERGIPAALLDGRDEELERLRGQRDGALREASELGAAIDLAAERDRRAEEEAEAERRRGHAAEANRLSRLRHAAATEVDEAMARLEEAVLRHDDVGDRLGRLVGGDFGARVGRSASQNLRWAMWRGAPRAAELLGVPFANGARRRPLAELCRPLQLDEERGE